jgi:hypothetical protein
MEKVIKRSYDFKKISSNEQMTGVSFWEQIKMVMVIVIEACWRGILWNFPTVVTSDNVTLLKTGKKLKACLTQ